MEAWTNWVTFLCSLGTQIMMAIVSYVIVKKTKKDAKKELQEQEEKHTKYIQDQISCKKREIWDIQKQITSIVCSGDKAMITSEYTHQLAIKLKQLKKDVTDLNSQLKPKDQDNTKLNVTESIKMLQETIEKFGGKK